MSRPTSLTRAVSQIAGSSLRRATSADVAREAGVSRATVSYVLNNTPHQKIPDATRTKVLEAAARLRYSPSAAARTLVLGRSDVVLALLPADLPPHPQFTSLVEHLSAALGDAGLTLVTHPWSRDRRPVTAVWAAIAPVAVIAMHLEDDEVAAMRDAGVEVVEQFHRDADVLGRYSGDVQSQIARIQVEALAGAGHRSLGFAMPQDERLQHEAAARLTAVQMACRDAAIPEPVVRDVGLDLDSAATAVAQWRDAHITGVVAYDDDTALAVLAGMRSCQLSAPRDLAVVGLYDLPAARLSDPPLTTVAIDSEAMARYAVTVLLRRLEGRRAPRRPGPTVARLISRGTL